MNLPTASLALTLSLLIGACGASEGDSSDESGGDGDASSGGSNTGTGGDEAGSGGSELGLAGEIPEQEGPNQLAPRHMRARQRLESLSFDSRVRSRAELEPKRKNRTTSGNMRRKRTEV